MHAREQHMCSRAAKANLGLIASASAREVDGGGSGSSSEPPISHRRATAVGDEGGDDQAICEGQGGLWLARTREIAGREGH